MEEKKIITTKEELQMLIGLAADQICNTHEEGKEGLIMDVAADICNKVNDHLTGRKKFSDDDIKRYKTLIGVFNLCEKLSGAVII